jgi:hypothetical protein
MDHVPPPQLVWDLVTKHTLARCLQVVADFGVADALGDRPASAGELASRTGMNADALGRMLRLLAANGVFAREAQGYVHTEASSLLRSDHPQSMRPLAQMIGMPIMWQRFTELNHVAKTGRPTMDWTALVAYFAQHPAEGSLFNQAMVAKSGGVIPGLMTAYDFSPFRSIVDVGGGRGHLLQAILERTPGAFGMVFDLPHVIADASKAASSRLRLVPGDFFKDSLPVADAYLLMEVIHDWADPEATRILTSVRKAAPPHARVLIIEALVSDDPGPHPGKVLDVIMLAVTGGRERTRHEYEALLLAAGFRMERMVETASPFSIIEAVVA